jgi:altronate hydrolase
MNLVEISPSATQYNAALLLHPDDTVAIARVALSAAMGLTVGGQKLETRQPIPAGHKVALRAMAAGDGVIRYGQRIGFTSRAIAVGEHVHLHNVKYEERNQQYRFPTEEIVAPPIIAGPTWQGYLREDGRAGTRNYIAVVAASNCAAHVAQLIARSFENDSLPEGVDGIVAFPHGEGCGHTIGPDTEQLRRTLAGVLDHPNVSSALILGLGCEVNQIDHYLGPNAKKTDRLVGMTVQGYGGTRATVDAARRAILPLMERAASEKRTELPTSKIVLGLNCGGSDSFSGITANPALGHCSDLLARHGAAAVLAETPECFGAEHLLVQRARNRAVAEKFIGCIENYRGYLRQFVGANFDDNPSPGNKEGGLTNILEKSLGAMTKAGTSALNEVVDYAERISGSGFVFMNTPGYDPVSITGLAAGGANLLAFTTGRGSAIGFPTVPVVKISTNTPMFRRMSDNMDVDAGRIAEGEATVQSVGQEIFEMVMDVASGRKTASERLGHQEFVPWRIGPVL